MRQSICFLIKFVFSKWKTKFCKQNVRTTWMNRCCVVSSFGNQWAISIEFLVNCQYKCTHKCREKCIWNEQNMNWKPKKWKIKYKLCKNIWKFAKRKRKNWKLRIRIQRSIHLWYQKHWNSTSMEVNRNILINFDEINCHRRTVIILS